MREEIRKRINMIHRGEVPEGYKKTKLGIVPEEWEVGAVKNHVVIKNELRTPINRESRAEMQGEYPYYGPTQVQDYIDRYSVEGKAVLIGEDGDHFLKYAEKEMTLLVGGKYSVNNHAHIVRGTDKCSEEWFYYVFMHKSLLNKITRQGASRYKLTKESLEDISFQLPSSEEQERITSILAFCDKRISLQSKLIEQKQKQFQWLMQCCFNTPVPTKKFYLYELGEDYNGLSGKSKSDFGRGKPYIPYKNVYNNYITDENYLEYVEVNDREKQECVKYGDILFTTSSEIPEEAGMASVYLGDEKELFLNSFCFGYRIKDFDVFWPEYAAFYFRSFQCRRKIVALAQGMTRFNLSPKRVVKMEIDLPELKQQKYVAEMLMLAQKEIRLLQQQLELYKQEKKAMMQLLLTGIVRVGQADTCDSPQNMCKY